MTALSLLAAAAFAVVCAALSVVAVRARAGAVTTSSKLRLRSTLLNASDEACRTGHVATWPMLAMTSAVAAFHTLGCAVSGLLLGENGTSFTEVFIVSGVLTVTALVFVARAAANATVKRSEAREDPRD